MEIDTGASLSLISKATYDKLQSSATLPPLKSEQIKLRTYTGEEINVLVASRLAGTIEDVRGPLTYMVRLSDGRVLKRHVDHIRKRTSMEPSNAQDVVPSHEESLSFGPLLDTEEPQPEQPSQSPGQHSIPVRSSSRIRRPPDRFRPDS